MRNPSPPGTIVVMSTTSLPVRRPHSGSADVPELVVNHAPDVAPAELADVLGWLTAESGSDGS